MNPTELLEVQTVPGGPNVLRKGPGVVRYVDSNGGGSTTSGGLTRNSAFTTLASAVLASAAGDTIVVCEGHSETFSSSGAAVTIATAGLKIIGEGRGSRRPTFTFSHTGATWSITGANVLIKNLLFVTGVDSVVTFATASSAATDLTLEDIETRDTTDVEVITDFTLQGVRPTIRRFFKNGYTGGDANVRVLSMKACDGALIEDCRFLTKVTTAILGFVTTLSAMVVIRRCTFYVNGTSITKDVVATGVSPTYSLEECFDLTAGSGVSGSDSVAAAGDDVSAVNSLVVSLGTADSTGHASVGTAVSSVGTKTATSTGLSTTQSSLLSLAAALGH